MSKIILSGYILVADKDLSAVLSELPKHILLTRAEAGCLVFEVQQVAQDKNKFSVYEEFTDKKSFELHQQRVANSKWGLVTKQVERFYKIEELN